MLCISSLCYILMICASYFNFQMAVVSLMASALCLLKNSRMSVTFVFFMDICLSGIPSEYDLSSLVLLHPRVSRRSLPWKNAPCTHRERLKNLESSNDRNLWSGITLIIVLNRRIQWNLALNLIIALRFEMYRTNIRVIFYWIIWIN